MNLHWNVPVSQSLFCWGWGKEALFIYFSLKTNIFGLFISKFWCSHLPNLTHTKSTSFYTTRCPIWCEGTLKKSTENLSVWCRWHYSFPLTLLLWVPLSLGFSSFNGGYRSLTRNHNISLVRSMIFSSMGSSCLGSAPRHEDAGTESHGTGDHWPHQRDSSQWVHLLSRVLLNHYQVRNISIRFLFAQSTPYMYHICNKAGGESLIMR